MGAIRMAFTLPESLVAWLTRISPGQRSRLVAEALERERRRREAEEVDRAFEAMAEDTRYRAVSESLDRDFARASSEALRVAEGTWNAAKSGRRRSARSSARKRAVSARS